MIFRVIFLVFCETFTVTALNCPISSTSFEKILGAHPPNSVKSTLLYELPRDVPSRPITAECIAKCRADKKCESFVLFHKLSQCFSYETNSFLNNDLIFDENSSSFRKICLQRDDMQCNKLWKFERIPGATLIGNDTEIIQQPITRLDCIKFCNNVTKFECRSAKFKLNSDNNKNNNFGTCVLSDTDRHELPSSYRVSAYDEEYLENQCVNKLLKPDMEFCGYEEYENATLGHADVVFERMNRRDCQKLCDEFKNFNCRGFSVVKGNVCYLHSEDSKVFGPSLLKSNAMAVYYEKAKCLNISVHCSETFITITYDPELNFNGRMYMQGYSDDSICYAIGEGLHKIVTLKIPLLTGDCGFIKAEGPLNRTLLSSALTIQYNPIIQTQNDRIIRVGCIFGNDTKVVVGTGVTISNSNSNKGSTLIDNTTTIVTSPIVEMRILDLTSRKEVSDTQIGQELQLLIEMKRKPDNNFDIWSNHLVAMTEKGDESIYLLDDGGCPTDLNIFPPLKKIVTNDSVQLTANFQAFKFASSSVVRFSVIIEFCNYECPPIICVDNAMSYGRKKRAVVSSSIQTINGTKIIETNRSHVVDRKLINNMPLEYIMVVRDPKSISDRLVINDDRLLIAGYDYRTDEVCMNYSLVIGLVILWMFIQVFFIVGCIILVRRYKRYYQHECMRQSLEVLHKNFGLGFSNLDNRRVHWEDT